jgi:hypothetical protein
MKVLAYFLVVVGALLFASIGYDEYRGVTRAPSSSRAGIAPGRISKESEPENFHNAIACHCYYAFAYLLLGGLMLYIDKRSDKSDIESPDYAGNSALDDWGRAMDTEAERRKVAKK